MVSICEIRVTELRDCVSRVALLIVALPLIAALFVVACGPQVPVALLTGSAECYDPMSGDLAFDPATGSITLDEGGGPNRSNGRQAIPGAGPDHRSRSSTGSARSCIGRGPGSFLWETHTAAASTRIAEWN